MRLIYTHLAGMRIVSNFVRTSSVEMSTSSVEMCYSSSTLITNHIFIRLHRMVMNSD